MYANLEGLTKLFVHAHKREREGGVQEGVCEVGRDGRTRWKKRRPRWPFGSYSLCVRLLVLFGLHLLYNACVTVAAGAAAAFPTYAAQSGSLFLPLTDTMFILILEFYNLVKKR